MFTYTIDALSINVFQASVAWTPYVIEEDGVKLTNVASLAAITATGEWYCNGTTCYVRATNNADPDTHTMQVGAREFSVDINNKDYVTVDGLTLSGANENGISLRGGSDYCILSNNTIKNIGVHAWGAGIHIYGGTYNTISTNDVSAAWTGITVEGFYSPLSNNNTIRGNTVHDTNSTGIQLNHGDLINNIIEQNIVYNSPKTEDDRSGITTYDIGAGNIIRYNKVYNGGGGAVRGSGITIDGNSGATQVYYNLVYGNTWGGINLTNAGHSVYNNILYHNNESTADVGEISIFTASSAGSSMTIKNNILVASASKHVIKVNSGNTTGHTIGYNDFYGGSATPFNWGGTDYNFEDWKTNSSQDAHSLNADPLFVSTVTPDFHLQSTSPAINAGVNVGLTSDYAGSEIWEMVDIGAYEYQPLVTKTVTGYNFTWPSVPGAIRYQVQIDIRADFSSPIVDIVTTYTSYEQDGLSDRYKYYWRVRAQRR